jgi:hypothetical protein
MGEIIAVDIDLRKITAVSSTRGVLANKVNPEKAPCLPAPDTDATLLVEIAGPVLHHDESHSYRRWMIYNVAVASGIAARYNTVLVAPSTAWTNGYNEEYRQAVAGILPKGKNAKGDLMYDECHDVRECRAMIYFYLASPKKWVPLTKYLEGL